MAPPAAKRLGRIDAGERAPAHADPPAETGRRTEDEPVRRDVAQQLGRLVFPGFITPTGAHRLADVERYLRGAEWRLQRLTKNAAVDRDRMLAINELERAYDAVLRAQVAGRPEGELADVPWMLEELRMSQFAQALGPKGQVTARSIRRILEQG